MLTLLELFQCTDQASLMHCSNNFDSSYFDAFSKVWDALSKLSCCCNQITIDWSHPSLLLLCLQENKWKCWFIKKRNKLQNSRLHFLWQWYIENVTFFLTKTCFWFLFGLITHVCINVICYKNIPIPCVFVIGVGKTDDHHRNYDKKD